MRSLLIVPLYIVLAFQLIHGQQQVPKPPVPQNPPVYDRDGASKNGDINSTIVGETGLAISTAQNLSCDIKIFTHNDNSFRLKYLVWARAKSVDQEKRFINLIEVKLHPYEYDHDNIHLDVLAPTRAPWEGTEYRVGVELNFQIPKDFKIDSRTSFSNLDFKGPFSSVKINNEYGTISLDNVNGESIIKTSYSTIELSRLKGAVSVEAIYSAIEANQITIVNGPGIFETSYGELTLENIDGSIEAVTDYEDIYASNIKAPRGSVILRTNYGRIDAENINSELVCVTNFEPINLREIVLSHGNSKFETKHAPIDVEILKLEDSQLIINNTYNSINLKIAPDISAKLLLAVDEGGKIHTQGLSIKPLVMERNRLVGLIGDGVSKIEMNIDGIGEVNIQGQ